MNANLDAMLAAEARKRLLATEAKAARSAKNRAAKEVAKGWGRRWIHEDETLQDIAAADGVTVGRVRYLLRKYGFRANSVRKGHRLRSLKLSLDEIVQMRQRGNKWKDIAIAAGYDVDTRSYRAFNEFVRKNALKYGYAWPIKVVSER